MGSPQVRSTMEYPWSVWHPFDFFNHDCTIPMTVPRVDRTFPMDPGTSSGLSGGFPFENRTWVHHSVVFPDHRGIELDPNLCELLPPLSRPPGPGSWVLGPGEKGARASPPDWSPPKNDRDLSGLPVRASPYTRNPPPKQNNS